MKKTMQKPTDMDILRDRVMRLRKKFEDTMFKNLDMDDDNEWLAALIALSFEAALVANGLGFDKQRLLNSFSITIDDAYGIPPAKEKAAPKKKAVPKKKPVVKKKAKK